MRTWWRLVHVCLDLPVGIISFSVIFSLAAVTLSTALLLIIPVGWLLMVTSRGLARAERTRVVTLLDVPLIDPVPELAATGWFRRLFERLRTRARWYEGAYLIVRFPLGLFTFLGTVMVWSASVMLMSLPVLTPHLPGGTAKFWLFEVSPGAGAVAGGVLGVVGFVVVAPWVTVAMASLDAWAARRLLGSPENEEMIRRLAEAEAGRSAAVDSAEAERRRIERDLHDGAQQRLVALAMDLGRARQRFDSDPDGARRLVDDAHEEAKEALGELRQLVRGIHPAILTDRGLDAALSSVVARSPVPVELDVHLTERLPAAIESAAYFVVTEALTNVARHAEATSASVSIRRWGETLEVAVSDDGRGGARLDGGGTGLAGLAERLAALGGTLSVSSPDGGPTTVRVEVPCGS